MARITAGQVQGVVEVDTVSWPDLTPFITAANELVTECCGLAGYTDERLALIETWLAAHFYTIADMRAAGERAGAVSVSYQFRVDLNLANTMYGQQAMLLDTAGGLAALNVQTTSGKGKVVGANWLGKTEDEYNVENNND